MIKIFGGLIIVFVGCVFGYYLHNCLIIRERSLIKMRTAFEYIKNAVVFQHMPIASVLDEVQAKSDLDIFGETLSVESGDNIVERWETMLCEKKEKLGLTDGDVEVFVDFMSVLSGVDPDGQSSNFDLAMQRIDSSIQDAKEKKDKYAKLYLFLSIGGSFLIVLFFL